MAEPSPAVKCPSCGSEQVVAVSLWLIPPRYFECQGCKVTFRTLDRLQDPPDVTRFNDGWILPPDKPKK